MIIRLASKNLELEFNISQFFSKWKHFFFILIKEIAINNLRLNLLAQYFVEVNLSKCEQEANFIPIPPIRSPKRLVLKFTTQIPQPLTTKNRKLFEI